MTPSSLRIVFMGTPDFAVPALSALIEGPDRIVAVVTQPDRPRGRGKKQQPPPVKRCAEDAGLSVLQPTTIRGAEFHDRLEALHPDLTVVAAYGRILPEELLRVPQLGTINVHGSLLPRYRGAAPIQWAIINGDSRTGITIMQMDAGMDTGDILLQRQLDIGAEETAGELFPRMARLGGEALTAALDRLRRGELEAKKQDEALVTMAPPLTKEMGHLDWTKSARELHCLIRGLDPWPSAFVFFGEKRYRLFAPRVIDGNAAEQPGTICRADREGLLIATGSGYLLIGEIQPDGRKRMTVQACLCGTSFPVGGRFI